ncbi:hypothetical protein, partial [Deinococcus sp. 6GRE01]|uniref:hypothetical protein n=1 Tax=Deinococcus sp. 6GRE01 TaxID=2745873 RepID=UPI001E2B1F79
MVPISTNVASANMTLQADITAAQRKIREFASQAQRDLSALTGLKIDATVKLKGPSKAEVSAALSNLKAEKVIKVKVDDTGAAAAIGRVKTLLDALRVTVPVQIKGPTRAEAAAALSNLRGEKTVKINIDSADAAATIGRIRTLLTGLSSSVNGLFSINTTGLGAILSGTTAMNTQFRATVAELRTVLEEIRRTRPANGPPAGGSGGGANLNPYAQQLRNLQADLKSGALNTQSFEAATRALKASMDAEIATLRSLGVLTQEQQAKFNALRAASIQAGEALGRVGATASLQQLSRDLQTAQSQYDRGSLSLRAYLRELERIRTAGQALGTGLRAGSEEAKRLETIMGGLSGATRKINDQSITKLRSDMAAARAEFERATAAAGRFGEKRAAVRAYEEQVRLLETRLRALGERSNVTTAQLGQINRLTAQLASQRNALDGVFTPLSLSGSVVNA